VPDDGRLSRQPARPAAAPRRPGLIQHYEAIAAASRAMRAAARADDWDEVTRLDALCRDLIGLLKAEARHSRLSVHEQRRRIEILRGILADDAEIRVRTEPWLRQLERLLPPAAGTPRG
jgi:flagellar protein FliT